MAQFLKASQAYEKREDRTQNDARNSKARRRNCTRQAETGIG